MSDKKKQQSKLLVKVRGLLLGLFEEGQTFTINYSQPDQSAVPF